MGLIGCALCRFDNAAHDKHPSPRLALARWDIYCRVIDNFGDIGVCWRLCQDLASRGHSVRLVTDDASALAWMRTPGGQPVEVLVWSASEAAPCPAPRPTWWWRPLAATRQRLMWLLGAKRRYRRCGSTWST
ncbi:elongation factor P maturation arginine rhamnosyltransferase EarP [Ideonella paludis]|uniref:elongation factor P maturation arginine rhamnosyltransferase EarP n=1 Tax=Ideonella paludis TaxID=1233411 RepID=UPI0036353F8B